MFFGTKRTMSFHRLCLVSILVYKCVLCYDYESSEFNRLEFTPLYDTIIFSDIADILNEIDNNVNTPINISESESDENIEDLLSEYHHYLERAQKQRLGYKEKINPKNKVPLLRHEKFVKTKPGLNMQNEYHKTNSLFTPNIKFTHSLSNNPIDFLVPLSSKRISTSLPISEHDNIPASCYCYDGQTPCKCACRQCFIPPNTMRQNYIQDIRMLSSDQGRIPVSKNVPYSKLNNKFVDSPQYNMDDSLNVRVKVDIQLPKFLETIQKYAKNLSVGSETKDSTSSLNLPLPYMNFPFPMELLGIKRSLEINNHETAPLHRFTIHKKKKSRTNNKKQHRKKFMSLRNMQIEPQKELYQNFDNFLNANDNSLLPNTINETVTQGKALTINNNENNETDIPEIKLNMNVTVLPLVINELETTTVVINMNKKIENGTDDHKSENSIEIDYMKTMNKTEDTVIRQKRGISQETGISSNNVTKVGQILNDTGLLKTIKQIQKDVNSKTTEKDMLSDGELLFWPNTSNNETNVKRKNITTLILEREDKKAKLNMTKDSIRMNHTSALEHAIFGDVVWDDMDTVTPAFISFVGKYIRGVLTFCSQTNCHSVNCADKKCVHRTCAPEQRFNNKGHCVGSNSTDSMAVMESLMDLPSNIAFEVVDILENKMQGNLFGKATLCINTKCSTFAVAKKKFVKSKCSTKELNSSGHCINVKNVKVM